MSGYSVSIKEVIAPTVFHNTPGILFRVEGLFVLRPVTDVDFVSVFSLWA
jgi:hypothetical protein